MKSFSKAKNSVSVKGLNSVVALALTVMLLHGAPVIAAKDTKNTDHKMAQNSAEYTAKVNVNREQMTTKNKGKMPASDNRIGAFSMKDGAMEGYYGDGEYNN